VEPSGQSKSPFSVHCAFVVQLREPPDLAHGLLDGRVEHVASGQTAQVQSVDDLLEFFAHMLQANSTKGGATGQHQRTENKEASGKE
jgi:hypothetical protein